MAETVAQDGALGARDISKNRHRMRLLKAAAQAVYLHGVRGATINKIQEISNLSRGMINLHFQSKENLLLAMVEDFAQVYTKNWRQAVAPLGDDPARRLTALITADLAPEVLNERDVTIWFAFRAEAKSHPEYFPYVDSRQSDFHQMLLQICQDLIDRGTYRDLDAKLATNALTAVLEGMWADFHLNPENFDRDDARKACLLVARGLFPKHF